MAILSLMNEVCFLMNGQSPELQEAKPGAGSGHSPSRWAPGEGKTTLSRAKPFSS